MTQELNYIMLVDDDKVNLFYCKTIIEDAYPETRIIALNTVDDAFDYLSNSSYMTKRESSYPFPDLILLDINMPKKDGWDFIEYYKKMKVFFAKKPVIIMVSSSL